MGDHKGSTLRGAREDQVKLLRGRGFRIIEIITDLQRSLVGISGVKCTGDGDHIAKLDIRVRRLKVLVRSVASGLRFKIPGNLVQDLVSYAVNRINTRRSGSISTESPRVKFTGRKVNYKREFTLSFGDYVECYDPTSRGNSTKEWTNSCIALHPYGNISGCWYFSNLLIGRRVRRGRWKKMTHTPDVIKESLNRLTSKPSVVTTIEDTEKREKDPDTRGADKEEMNHDAVDEKQSNEEDSDTRGADEEETKDEPNRDELRRSHRLKFKRKYIMRQKGTEGFSLSNISVKRAIKHDPKCAAEAIHKELEQILKGKKVFTPVKRSDVPQSRVIRSHMFLKYKHVAQGKFEKLKARLVADGKVQDREQYPDKYSPTVPLEAIMFTLKVVSTSKKAMPKFDIKGAYLNADLDEEL